MVTGAKVHLPDHVTFPFPVELDDAARTDRWSPILEDRLHEPGPSPRRYDLFVRRDDLSGRRHAPAESYDPIRKPAQQPTVVPEALCPGASRLREPPNFRLLEKLPLTLPADIEIVPAALHTLLPKIPAKPRNHSP